MRLIRLVAGVSSAFFALGLLALVLLLTSGSGEDGLPLALVLLLAAGAVATAVVLFRVTVALAGRRAGQPPSG